MISCLLHLWVLIIRHYIVLIDTVSKNGIGCAANTLRFVKTFSSSTLYWTDKSSLKFICWKECKFCQATKLHTHERRDATRGLINWGICHLRLAVCWKANQKAWRNLTAGRLASHPPPPLQLSSVVEGISMARAYSPGSISILLYLFPDSLYYSRTCPWKKVLKHMLISRLLKCIAVSVFACVFACMRVCLCVLLQ